MNRPSTYADQIYKFCKVCIWSTSRRPIRIVPSMKSVYHLVLSTRCLRSSVKTSYK